MRHPHPPNPRQSLLPCQRALVQAASCCGERNGEKVAGELEGDRGKREGRQWKGKKSQAGGRIPFRPADARLSLLCTVSTFIVHSRQLHRG